MSGSRQHVLSAVRSALAKQSVLGKRGAERLAGYESIPRAYTTTQSLTRAEILDLFEERLVDYDAATHRCSAEELPGVIAKCLGDRTKVVIPKDLPALWLPPGIEFVRDTGLSYPEIDAAGGVITACATAIALTGTLVLQDGAVGQGRRVLTLLPDYYLCIVQAHQVVHTVAEGLRAIGSTATLATTTISGPSATADIEMIRIRGVHGPRFLEVVIVV